LLAPKQFTGLWKHNPQQSKYDSSHTLCTENEKMARLIIAGVRLSEQRIYYWAGSTDRSGKHGKFVKRKKINSQTIHWNLRGGLMIHCIVLIKKSRPS